MVKVKESLYRLKVYLSYEEDPKIFYLHIHVVIFYLLYQSILLVELCCQNGLLHKSLWASEGSNLTIGEMSSKSNLGILYKGLKFEINNGVKLIISDFLVAPRLNFKKPLYFKASKVSLENRSLRVNFSNISSVLSIDYNDIGSSSLLGEMEDLKADELIAIQNIDFLIHGLSSKNSELEFKADQLSAQVLVPKGRIDLFGKAVFSTELGDGISTYLEIDDVNLDLSMVQNFNQRYLEKI